MTTPADAVELQHDELEAISVMFGDDVTVHSDSYPISYSIKLRPTHEEVEDASLWPRDENIALTVEYPTNYPDDVPILGLMYSKASLRLHQVQENAILTHINAVAESEMGTPCILSCFYAGRDFFDSFGLIQATLSMLSDDCLACVLSFLATTKEDVDRVVTALPLFAGVYKTDIVWKELCCNRWKKKWGFTRRWKKALDDFQRHCNQPVTIGTKNVHQIEFFWFNRYDCEEHDSKRRAITRDDLCNCAFEQRRWFNNTTDPLNITSVPGVLPTGLCTPGLVCQFTFSGQFLGFSINEVHVQYSFDNTNPNVVMLSSMGSSVSLTTQRTPDWGWQLSNNDIVMRSMDEPGDRFASSDLLWKDLTSNIVMQERPPGVASIFNWREIPDDEELQFLLLWRNSWRAPVRHDS